MRSFAAAIGERQAAWSEWQDLNLRPPRPERGALPDCATLRLAEEPVYNRLGLSPQESHCRAGAWHPLPLSPDTGRTAQAHHVSTRERSERERPSPSPVGPGAGPQIT